MLALTGLFQTAMMALVNAVGVGICFGGMLSSYVTVTDCVKGAIAVVRGRRVTFAPS
jgi:hypothetical protein